MHIVRQDLAIADILQQLKREAPYGLLAFRNVGVGDPITETTAMNQTVIVDEGRIVGLAITRMNPLKRGTRERLMAQVAIFRPD